jgi:hypothetical protein
MNDEHQQQDDRWSWVLMGVILIVTAVVLYGPLVWEITSGS